MNMVIGLGIFIGSSIIIVAYLTYVVITIASDKKEKEMQAKQDALIKELQDRHSRLLEMYNEEKSQRVHWKLKYSKESLIREIQQPTRKRRGA